MNKDWMDAVREQSLSDVSVPSPDGWSKIGRKMRRAAAWRRSAVSAAILLSMAAILLWTPWHQPSAPTALERIPIAQNVASSVSVETPIEPGKVPYVPRSLSVIPRYSSPVVQNVTPSVASSAATDLSDIRIDSNAVQNKIPVESEASANPEADKESPAVSISSFNTFSEPTKENRPRLSIGFRAGSGTEQRNAGVTLQSAPYIAALTYMNAIELPTTPRVKSNYSTTVGYGAEANQFFPGASTNQYHHDLPLSLGVTVRAEVTPRVGVESGVDYTYLHSAMESAVGRLDQHLHFIGIPVRLDTRLLSRDGFDLYAGVGAKAEKCVAASLGQISCEENRIQWSAEAFAGVQYGIWNKAHLFFQPEVSYYFTETDLVTYRTVNPFTFTIHAGLRFDL